MKNEPEEFKRQSRTGSAPYFVLAVLFLIGLLMVIILIQPMEVSISGRIAGDFKGLISLFPSGFVENFKINNATGSVDVQIRVKAPIIIFYILQNWGR